MNRSRSVLWLIPAVIIILILAGYFFVQNRTPSLLSYAPVDPDGFQLRQAEIRLEFSQPMEPQSVTDNLTIQPAVDGEFHWEQNTLIFTPKEPWVKGTLVRVLLREGMHSEWGIPLQDYPETFSFQVEDQLMLYLSPADQTADIYLVSPESGFYQRLTEHQGVLDYDPGPEGVLIYYAAYNQTDGSDLYVYDRASDQSAMVLDCGGDLCSQVQVNAEGEALLYVRQEGSRQPEVWLLELDGGETEQLSPEGRHAESPLWSDQGLICYYDYSALQYTIVSLEDFSEVYFDNSTGEKGTWLGEDFVAPELIELEKLPYQAVEGLDDYFTSHLIAFDSSRQTYRDLTNASVVEDTWPTASPDENWLAFTRKYQDPSSWQLGRQLWVMRSNGANPHALTDMPDYRITGISWRPDNQQIAFVRFEQTMISEAPEIWLISLDGEESFRLVIDAFSPQWLP